MKLFSNLGYYYHKQIYLYKDKFYAQPLWAKPINEIANYSNILTIFAPTSEIDKKISVNLIELNFNVKVVSMPVQADSFLDKFLKIKNVKKTMKAYLEKNKIDQILFECPSFYIIYIHSLFKNKSVFFFIGDMPRNIISSNNLAFLKKILLFTYWEIDKLIISLKANKEISFGGNYKGYLRGKYINQYPLLKDKTCITLQTFSAKDVIFRKKLEKFPKEIRILLCQRLDATTNTKQIIEITKILLSSGHNIIWNIIGSIADYSSKEDDTEISYFQDQINKNNLEKNILLLGNIEHGTKFNQVYESSHVYIAPNKTFGGNLGRHGWEALSKGLPLITTPQTKRLWPTNNHDCLITEFGETHEYITLFNKLFSDIDLYNRISINASTTAYGHNLEKSVSHMMSHILHTSRYKG